MSEDSEFQHQIEVVKIKALYVFLVFLGILDILSTYIALRIGLIEGNIFVVLMMYRATFITIASLKSLIILAYGFWLFYRLHTVKKNPEDAVKTDLIIYSSIFFLIGFQACLVFNNFMMIILQII